MELRGFQRMDFSLDGIKNSLGIAGKNIAKPDSKAHFFHKYSVNLNQAIIDTVDIKKGEKATAFGKWLTGINKSSPWLGEKITSARNFLHKVHQGRFFKGRINRLSARFGKFRKAIGLGSNNVAKATSWFGKQGVVSQFIGKSLKNLPMKGPLFMTALIDGVISVGTAVKDVLEVTEEKGIFHGLWAGAKSLAKSATGIGAGVLAAGAATMALGVTGPIGWAIGTVAYLGGSYLGNKAVGAILPAQTEENEKNVSPFAGVSSSYHQSQSHQPQRANYGPEQLSLTRDEAYQLQQLILHEQNQQGY